MSGFRATCWSAVSGQNWRWCSKLRRANANRRLPGASISKLNVAIAEELQVFAGNGGLGLPASPGYAAVAANPKGGSISTVHITSAFVGTSSSSGTPTGA